MVEVDGTRLNSTEIKLDPGDSWEGEYQLRPELDALKDNHTVTVSTFGDYTEFEFTYEIDPENPGEVEVPRITNVSVGNAVIDGKPSSVVNVTVVNPSIQTYSTKLMVHTEGTDGSFYPAIVPPGETETITVELLDDQNTEIAGEARLYTDDFNESEGGIHQVGFVGRAGGSSEMWNESFEPVAAPWSEDPYQYHNASIGGSEGLAERASGGVDLWGVPIVYFAGSLLLGAFVLRRFLTG
ncbi:hypothetical protein ACFQPE_02710 [Halomarina halobia]|uniref:CARDB domain-containing protein n=1 Tax=Halomarina halobia TaxID=3033386 RepID=A0ABD6A570_9EURY